MSNQQAATRRIAPRTRASSQTNSPRLLQISQRVTRSPLHPPLPHHDSRGGSKHVTSRIIPNHCGILVTSIWHRSASNVDFTTDKGTATEHISDLFHSVAHAICFHLVRVENRTLFRVSASVEGENIDLSTNSELQTFITRHELLSCHSNIFALFCCPHQHTSLMHRHQCPQIDSRVQPQDICANLVARLIT